MPLPRRRNVRHELAKWRVVVANQYSGLRFGFGKVRSRTVTFLVG